LLQSIEAVRTIQSNIQQTLVDATAVQYFDQTQFGTVIDQQSTAHGREQIQREIIDDTRRHQFRTHAQLPNDGDSELTWHPDMQQTIIQFYSLIIVALVTSLHFPPSRQSSSLSSLSSLSPSRTSGTSDRSSSSRSIVVGRPQLRSPQVVYDDGPADDEWPSLLNRSASAILSY